MIKSTRQYRSVPSFDEVMNEQSKPIPSFEEVMGGEVPKKKVGGDVSKISSQNTNLSLGGEKNQNIYDPVRDALNPLRNQYQQAQSAFNPLRNRAVSDQTRNAVLPTNVRNQQFQESDFNIKKTNEKVASANLQKAQVEVHKQLSNVKNAKETLEDVKKKNGGVIPVDNETAAIAKKASDSFDQANQNNRLVNLAANSTDIKDFVRKYSATPITNDKELEEKTWEALNDPNVEEAFRRNPKKWGMFVRESSNFNNLFPNAAKQKLSSQIAQWMDETNKGGGLVSRGYSKKDLDAQVEKQYKLGKINAIDRAFYYQNIKPSDIPTTGDLNIYGRNYEQALRNSFLGRAISKVGLMENPVEKYKYEPTVDPKRVIGKGAELAGQLTPMLLTTPILKAAGFTDKAANIISVVNQFGPTNQDRGEELFPNDPAKKWAYTIFGSMIDALITEIPILKSKVGILKSEAEKLSKVLVDKTVNSSVKEQAKKTFLDRLQGFIGTTAKNTAHTSSVITGIGTAHKLLDVAANAPHAVENLEHTDFVDEFINNAKAALLLGGVQAAGKLIPEAKQPIERQPQSPPPSRVFDELPFEQKVINSIKREGKMPPFMQEHLDNNPEAIIAELKDQVEQGMKGGAANHTGAIDLMYGKTAVDLVKKQIEDEQSGKPVEPINQGSGEDMPKGEQGVVGELGKGVEVGTNSSGENIGDKEQWQLTQDESYKKYADTDNGEGLRSHEEMAADTLSGIENGNSGLSIEGKKVVYRNKDGKAVGYAQFNDKGITEIGVDKNERGKSISTKMVEFLKKEKGIDTILPPFSKEGNIVSHRNEVKKAIEEGKFDKAIANGEMTKERADEIIKSAKLSNNSSGEGVGDKTVEDNYESKFPKPSKPLEQLTSDELYDYAKTVKEYNKNLEKEFFGEEGAKKYREAQSISNSMFAPRDKQKEADKIIDEFHAKLTPKQENEFFAMNAPDGLIYDHTEIADIASKVSLIEGAENVNDIARSLKIPLLSFNKNKNNLEAKILFSAATKKATELGISPEELIKESIKNVAKDIPDENDREFLAKSILENIVQGSQTENTQKQLANEIPVPTEKESTPIKEPNQNIQPTSEGEKSAEPIGESNEGQPPSETPPVEGIGEVKGGKVSGITHADTAESRKELGLPEYEGQPKGTHSKLIEDAKETIAKNPNAANEVMDKYRAGGKMTPEDNAILSEYKAALDYQLEKNPSKEVFDRLNELIKVLEPAGTEAGKLLESRKLLSSQEDNLTNFLLDKQESQGAPLTEKQFKEEAAKYEELKKAKEDLEKQLAEEKEKYNRLAAEKGINKDKAEAKKASKKSREDYVSERKKIIDDIKNKWKNVGKDNSLHLDLPFRQQLTEIAPDVKKYVQSLLEEGIDKLDDIATTIHADLKDFIDGIKKSDIIDIMAGEYDKKEAQTKNQKANAARLLEREAKLLNELSRARKGEENAKSTAEKIQASRRIEELKEKIKEVRQQNKENTIDEAPNDTGVGDAEMNAALEKKLLAKVKRLQEDIKNKKYLQEEPPKQPFTKSRKAQILEDRVIDLENKIRHERSVDQYNKRGKVRKVFDKVMEILGVRRLVQSAVDISVPFRQGATLLSPRQIDVWAKGFQANLRSVFSPQKFERIMYAIRHDPMYHDMVKDRVVFNDLGSADPNLHNEDFRKSFIYKIPIISEPLKASNRSADAFLNVARYEMYKKLRARLEAQGLTRESDPQAFKYIGNWTMSMTGRGRMTNMLENSVAHTVLGNTFYGARLMASRFNMLNPVTYLDPRVPRQARIEAFKDIAAWVGTTMAIGAGLAATTGAKISLNPDDGDFLQLRYGKKVYDISGGLVTYIRTFLRLCKAGYIRATGTKYEGKKATENAGQSVLNFFRNKLSPNTAYGTNAFFGKPYGQPFDPYEVVKIYPMYADDAYKAIKEDGMISLATVLLPNLVGIGYGSYASKGQIDATVDDLLQRNLRSDEMNNQKIKNYKEGGRLVTFSEFNNFADKRDEVIKEDLQKLFDNGINGKKYKELTPEELADEVAYIKSHATEQVKEELFGKPKKTETEKRIESQLQKARKNLYK